MNERALWTHHSARRQRLPVYLSACPPVKRRSNLLWPFNLEFTPKMPIELDNAETDR